MAEENNGFLAIDELDFEGIKQNLRNYLKQQTRFKDYNFEGSNLSVLIDLLAKNSYLNAHYTNMLGSEMWMDTAKLRESIVSHAKELNYVPRSKVAATAYIDITVDVGSNTPEQVVIPQYYPVKATVNGATYTFTTDEAIILTSSSSYKAEDVPVKEGQIVTEYFVAAPGKRYVIASDSVDTSSVRVSVQTSNTNTANTEWLRETSLYGLRSDDKVFFVQGAEAYRYELVFGNNVTGKALDAGNVIKVTYRNTNGADANGVKKFEAKQAIDGYSTIAVTTKITSSGGQEHEDESSIKFSAPRFFTTQERAVTRDDYITLIKNRFPSLQTVTAYGGEEAEPRQYGRVIISGKLTDREIVPTKVKQEIVSYIRERAALSIDPVFHDPEYLHLEVVSDILYNLNRTTKTANDIRSLVAAEIVDFGSTNLMEFGSDLYYSHLVRAIDFADSSIVSNDTRCRLIKKLAPVLDTKASYSIRFDNELIYRSKVEPAVMSSYFTYMKAATTYESCFLRDNGAGVIELYYTPRLGEEVLLNSSAGTVDYTTGVVQINSLNVQAYLGATLNVYASLAAKDVQVSANKLILISSEDLTLNVEAVRL